MCVHFRDFQFARKTGLKFKKRSMKKFRGVGWGYVIQNQISPDFRFPEVVILQNRILELGLSCTSSLY